jgi:uncharacterized protein (TIGR02757 family)
MLDNVELKILLDDLYQKYNHRQFVPPDPLQFVYKYSEPTDMEIVGLLSAAMAYGRVEQIAKSLTNLFAIMGKSPAGFTVNFSKKDSLKLADFRHRFNTGQDIAGLLTILKQALKKSGNLEKFFLIGYDPDASDIIPALSGFITRLLSLGKNPNNRAIKYLLTNPANQSCCKRMFLFLRWMVRNDKVDCGLWKSVNKAKLIVPVDVHIGRLCKILGFHNNKTMSLKTAIKITERFRKISPNDPTKYDFALSRIGILENCTGKKNPYCLHCQLRTYCKNH